MFSLISKQRKNSYILTAALFVVVLYFVFQWFDLQGKINDQNRDINFVNKALVVQEYKNEEMKRITAPGNESEYLEHIARADYGFVLPGERVYHYEFSGN